MNSHLPTDEALALLPARPQLWVLRESAPGAALFSAQWSREDVAAAIQRFGATLATDTRAIDAGCRLRVQDAVGVLFFETRE